MITGTDATGQTTARWAQTRPDLTDYASQGPTAATTSREALTSNIATAPARPRDPAQDRVLSFQQSAAGDAALWQLTSPTSTTEPGWHSGDHPATGSSLHAGGTYTFTQRTQVALAAPSNSGSLRTPVSTTRRDSTSLWQQWTLVAARSGGYRLVGRADGLCLNLLDGNSADDATIGAWPCPSAETDDTNDVWLLDQAGGDAFALINKQSKKALTYLAGGPIGQRDYTHGNDLQTWHLAEIGEPGGAVPSWSTWASSTPGMPSALAAGDLDRFIGGTNQYADEAAVAFIDDDHKLQIRVIDYNANASHLLAVAPDKELATVGTTVDDTWYPGSVGVAIGNFSGEVDGARPNQLAVTWQDQKGIHATFLQYNAAGANRTLNLVQPDVLLAEPTRTTRSGYSDLAPFAGMSSTTVGDFDGDDVDDLAVSFAGTANNDADPDRVLPFVSVNSFTPALELATAMNRTAIQPAGDPRGPLSMPKPGTIWAPNGVRLVPGLFGLDTAKGQTIRRRQLAAVWTEQLNGENTYAALLSADRDDDDVKLTTLSATLVDSAPSIRQGNPTTLSVTAGGLGGRGADNDIPLWGLAVANRSETKGKGSTGVHLFLPQPDGTLKRTASPAEDGYSNIRVQAYDQAGSSIVLGVPVVINTDQYQTSFIAAQPPAHSDWLGDRFVNVSRNAEFVTELGSGSETTTASTHSTKSSSTVGGSESADSKTTVTEGLAGIETVSGQVEIAQKFDREKEQEKAKDSKFSSTTEYNQQSTSNDDDLVNGADITRTIYRYPILGGPLTTTDGQPATTALCKICYGYYEVTVPGKVVPMANSYGKNDDYFQPSWQNGNALSYPALVDGRVPTPDIGSYTVKPPTGSPTTINSAAMFNQSYDLGGGRNRFELTMTDSKESGTERTSGGSMTNSQEVKVGAKVKFGVGIAKASEKVEISGGADEKSTWATTDTTDTETKTSTSFGIEAPQIDETQGYRAGSAFYVDKAGTQKVVHGVDLTASQQSRQWWTKHYGTQPDLALNLPLATTMVKGDLDTFVEPKWNPLDSRQRIRGFYALQPTDPTSATTSSQPYAVNPTAGDPVSFQVQVHNYSLRSSPAATAAFYAVPVDADRLKVTGGPQALGTVTVPGMQAQGVASITSSPWKAVGPTDGPGLQNWRVFVVLDPNDEVAETHEWKGSKVCPAESIDQTGGDDTDALTDPMTDEPETLTCGQNNQGFGEITVMGRNLQSSATPANLSLTDTTLLTGNKLQAPQQGGTAQAVVNQQLQGVVHATTRTATSTVSQVMVYDGSPKHGQLLAHLKLSGADSLHGGTALFSWRPTTAGRHVLNEVLISENGTTQVHKTTVQVARHAKQARLVLNPTRSTAAIGTPAAYTTTTVDAYGNAVDVVTRNTKLRMTPEGSCRAGSCVAAVLGAHTVTATYQNLTTTAALSITAPTLTLRATEGQGQQARTGHRFSTALQVSATGRDGRPAAGVPVRFRTSNDRVKFRGAGQTVVVRTDRAGRASAPRLVAGRRPGQVIIRATSGRASSAFILAVQETNHRRTDLAVTLRGARKSGVGAATTAMVRIVNHGPHRAHNTLIAVDLPSGVTVTSAVQGSRIGSSVVFRIPKMGTGHSRRFAIEWRPARPGPYILTATTVSTTAERHRRNNHTSRTVTVS